MSRVGFGLLVALAGCVSSSAVPCGDGTFCPAGTRCYAPSPDRPPYCLSPDEIDPCEGKLEGDACTIEDRPGECRGGACITYECGDELVTGAERCDGENLGVSTLHGMNNCIDLGFYSPDGLTCTSQCTYDVSGCEANGGGWCGDLRLNGPELCDGSTNRTCVAIGFDAGTVTCNAQCGFTIRDCTRFGWTPETLNGVVALAIGGSGPDDHWAVGDDGRAMRFEGAFWNPVPTGVTNSLIAVSALSRDDAWMVGLSSTNPARPAVILHWDGVSWAQNTTAPVAEYVDVWAAASNRVYVASNDQGIQFWNGTTWTELGAITGTPIAIRGTTNGGTDDIYVATNEGPLWRWTGTTWAAATPINARLRFLDVNSSTDVWGIGHDDVSPSNGVIAHWDGATWTTWRANGEIYNNIASSGPEDAWVAGADDTMRHFDGVAWTNTLPIGASPSGLAAISGFLSFGPNEVVAVSTQAIAYRYRGMAYGRFKTLPTFDQNQAMWVTRPDDVFVGNVKGEIWHLDGQAWTNVFTVPEIVPGSPVGIRSSFGLSTGEVYFGDIEGRIFEGNGTTFTQDSNLVNTTGVDAIWGTSPGNLWVFSTSGAFHRTGATWTRHLLSSTNVFSVSGTGASDIWAVTGDRKLWHWDGSAWTERSHTIGKPIRAVVAVAPDSVFVAAEEGRIGHTTDGSTWTVDIVPAVAPLTFMASSARDDVIAASERELFHHDGREWAPIRPPVDFVPNTPDFMPLIGIQVSPGRIDMLLERLRVRTMIRTRPIACRGGEAGNCGNGIDDDCDGKLDSVDDECP